jgi:translation initiation factor eIF-2B subunit delta
MLNKKIQRSIDELREDNASGANELFLRTIDIIKNQMHLVENKEEDIKDLFFELAKGIINARPSMAPLINTIGYIINNIETYSSNNIINKIIDLVSYNAERNNKLLESFVYFFDNYYSKDIKIMLISYSSTIINLNVYLKDYGSELYVLESRPLYEGRRTAEILSQYMKTHLIIDAAIGKYIEDIDLVLIGVDSILNDGSIINKIGTYPLSIIAKENDIAVYAIADSFKYNLRSHFKEEVKITTKPIKEVYEKKIKSNLLRVHNYYFDITPAKYIKGIISDLGVLSPLEFVDKVKSVLPIDWFQSFL